MSYTIKIHNVETDEIIERDMTPEEIEIKEKENAELAEKKKVLETQEKEKIAARQAILDRLGLTEEEVRLLLG